MPLFFTCCALIILLPRFSSKTIDIPTIESIKGTTGVSKDFQKILDDDGAFTFSETGFTIKMEKDLQSIRWDEIKTMLGYKRDLFAVDCICLDVFTENGHGFSISEEMPGWYRFLQQSKLAFPAISKTWEFEIAFPAFETKLTVIYDKYNRTLPELEKEYYKEPARNWFTRMKTRIVDWFDDSF